MHERENMEAHPPPNAARAMPLSTKLSKPLTARIEDFDGLDDYQDLELINPDVSEPSDNGELNSTPEYDVWDEDPREAERRSTSPMEQSNLSDTESEAEDVQQRLNSISFGALARANDAMGQGIGRKRMRDGHTVNDNAEKLEALRDRLHELKAYKSRKLSPSAPNKASKSRRATDIQRQHADIPASRADFSSLSNAGVEKEGSRLSKHAPAIQSSKRPVSRNRTVLAVSNPRPKALDPRFSSLSGPAPDPSRLRQRYAFLNDYRQNEMDELRTVLNNSKKASGQKGKKRTAHVDEETRDRLKKELGRMENRARAESDKERQERVMHEWKRAEREKVQQGKKPFYLKNSEQKKLTLADKFENMKAKEREKAVKQRRKREGEREKRSMPAARRVR